MPPDGRCHPISAHYAPTRGGVRQEICKERGPAHRMGWIGEPRHGRTLNRASPCPRPLAASASALGRTLPRHAGRLAQPSSQAVKPAERGLKPPEQGLKPPERGLQYARQELQYARQGLQYAGRGLQYAERGLQYARPVLKPERPVLKPRRFVGGTQVRDRGRR